MKGQARHVYKKVEMDKIINIEAMKQEIEDRLNEEDKTETNPYQMAILIKYLEMKLRQKK